MKAVRFAATMKATALNIIRAAAYKKRTKQGKKFLITLLRRLDWPDFGYQRAFLRFFGQNSDRQSRIIIFLKF
jgi:hypothetical protein